MENTQTNNYLELHYFFVEEDKSHSMNAIVRNRCEYELLHIIKEVSKSFDFQVLIETEAYDKGGLVEFYKFFVSSEGQAIISASNFLVAIIALILASKPSTKSKLDKKEQKLRIEESQLRTEIGKIDIQLLKQELEQKRIKFPNINNERIEYLIDGNLKINKHRSNYYKSVNNYPKIRKISTAILNEHKDQVNEPWYIDKSEFIDFILESDKLEPIYDENASIEIISPVLKKGKNFKWRGIYNLNPEPIEFSMNREFKERVIQDGIAFKSGTFIDCILKIERRIDDFGYIKNTNYSVVTVLKQRNDGISTETPEGKKIRKDKEADQMQGKLFGFDV